MMKKIIISVGSILLIVLIIIIIFVIKYEFCIKVDNLLLSKIDNEVNYNNYVSCQTMDWHNEDFYYIDLFFGITSDIKRISGDDVSTEANNITSFQIFNDSLYYLREKELWKREMTTGNETLIEPDVLQFIVCNSGVFCVKNKQRFMDLIAIDNLGNHKFLIHNAGCYCLDKNCLYILEDPVMINRQNPIIYKCSLSDFTLTKIGVINDDSYEGSLLMKNNIVCYNANDIFMYNIRTQKINHVFSYDDGIIASVICDNDNIYFSLKRVFYNGSITHTEESEDNGLYMFDAKLKMITKISDECFSSLYLKGNYLMGRNQDNIKYYNLSLYNAWQ